MINKYHNFNSFLLILFAFSIIEGCSVGKIKDQSLPKKDENKHEEKQVENKIDRKILVKCIQESDYSFPKCFSESMVDILNNNSSELKRLIGSISHNIDCQVRKKLVFDEIMSHIILKSEINDELEMLNILATHSFYTDSKETLIRYQNLFHQLEEKGKLDEESIKSMFREYVSHGLFKEAKALRNKYSFLEEAPAVLPDNNADDNIEEESKTKYFTVKDEHAIQILEKSPLEGKKIIVSSSMDCGVADIVLKKLYEDKEVRNIMKDNALIISKPSGFHFSTKDVLAWNQKYPEFKYYYTVYSDLWKYQIDLGSTPRIYVLNDEGKWVNIYNTMTKEQWDEIKKVVDEKKKIEDSKNFERFNVQAFIIKWGLKKLFQNSSV